MKKKKTIKLVLLISADGIPPKEIDDWLARNRRSLGNLLYPVGDLVEKSFSPDDLQLLVKQLPQDRRVLE